MNFIHSFQRAIVLLVLIAATTSAGDAHSSNLEACFENEVDQNTGRRYQNHQQWAADVTSLKQSTPDSPGWIRLYRGYQAGRAAAAERIKGSDKRKHCYVGCRIAAEVDYDVAVYAAYYKELQDLEDCSLSTRSDYEDIEATVVGAQIAQDHGQKADKKLCASTCANQY